MTKGRKQWLSGFVFASILVTFLFTFDFMRIGREVQETEVTEAQSIESAMSIVEGLKNESDVSMYAGTPYSSVETGIVEVVATGEIVEEIVEEVKPYFNNCDDTNYEVTTIYENRKNPWSTEHPVGTGADFTNRIGVWYELPENAVDVRICVTVDHSKPISVSNLYLSLGYFNKNNEYSLIGGQLAQNITGGQLPYTQNFDLLNEMQKTNTYQRNYQLQANRNISKNVFYNTTETTFADAYWNNRDNKIQINAMYNSTQRGKTTVKIAILRS